MSELPDGWIASTVGTVAEVQLGKMLDKVKNKGEPTTYLRNINVRWGSFDLADLAQMRMTQDERGAFSIRDGDIMVCEGGEPGRAAVWRGGPTTITYQKALMRLRSAGVMEPDLLQAFLREVAGSGALNDHFTGTTIKHLPQNVLRQVQLPVPPLAEQRRIVAKLDALTARTARARADLDRIPALAARYKQAVLAKAFSGELTARWRAENGSANAWLAVTVGDVTDISSGFGFPKDRQGNLAGDFPFAKVSDISRAVATNGGLLTSANNYVFASDLKSLRAKPVSAGSVVFAKIGEALRLNRRAIATIPLVLDNNCMALTPNVNRVDPRYLYQFMRTVDLSPLAVATAVPSVRRGDVASLAMPLPPLHEQHEVVHRIDRAFAEIDRLATEAAAARRLLDRLDQAVLSKAFRGELVPQDPADEPASFLLSRTLAERANTPKVTRGRRKAVA